MARLPARAHREQAAWHPVAGFHYSVSWMGPLHSPPSSGACLAVRRGGVAARRALGPTSFHAGEDESCHSVHTAEQARSSE